MTKDEVVKMVTGGIGRVMAEALLTVGRNGEAIRLVEQTPTALGQKLTLEHQGKPYRLALPLIGAYQASNVLTAAGLRAVKQSITTLERMRAGLDPILGDR